MILANIIFASVVRFRVSRLEVVVEMNDLYFGTDLRAVNILSMMYS